MRIQIALFAARQEPAPLEEPQGRGAGPALRSYDLAQVRADRIKLKRLESTVGLPA